jgi:haloacetate dehalogenase
MGLVTFSAPSKGPQSMHRHAQGPLHAHAICEEYRAAANIDRTHDKADFIENNQIACPLLALWSAEGPLGSWYADDGGPLALWRTWAKDVQGHGVNGGHFFPEEIPDQIARTLSRFLKNTPNHV